MSKKLILCFDGTCNEPSDAREQHTFFGGIEDGGITNVLKLHLMLGGDLADGQRFANQLSLYHAGVGTEGSKVRRIYNAAFAPVHLDVGRIIKAGVADVKKHWKDGDELFVFGFSRGAAIARRFCSVLKDHVDPAPRIRFVGVFDTVAAIGVPNLDDDSQPVSDVVFQNATISPAIDEALHLVSLDDRRKAFLPTLMSKDPRVTEVWMPGVHSDVGGGYREDGLSDIALGFLLEQVEARVLGLATLAASEIDYESVVPRDADFDIDLDDVIMQPDPFGTMHIQKRLPLATRITLTTRVARVNVHDLPSSDPPIVHHTIAERLHRDINYRAESLRRTAHELWLRDGTTQLFADVQEHRRMGALPVARLAVGEQREIVCVASLADNLSGVMLVAGESYAFSVNPDQRWFDDTVCCGPEGWSREEQSLGWKESAIWSVEWMRRVPDARWFTLIGSMGNDDTELFELLDHTDTPYVPMRTAELSTFANDLRRSYGNNSGSMRITVSRVR